MLAKAAVFLGPEKKHQIREFPVPDPKPGAAVVKVHLCNICGSDLHQWRGEGGTPVPPQGRVLGHEVVGEIFRLGEGVNTDSMGRPLKEGDRVVWTYFYPCRRCPACTSGNFVNCAHRLDHNQATAEDWPHLSGGYAEYYYLRPNHFVFKVPEDLPDELVSSANCALSQVIEALNRANFRMGDTLVVQGAGGLGLYAVAVANSLGAEKIIAIDGIPQRLELARDFGADEGICLSEFPTPESRVQKVRELTEGQGVTTVMELVGHPSVIPEGLQMLQPGGTYLEVGMVTKSWTAEIFPARLVRAQTRYLGVNHYNPIVLARALEFLRRNRKRYPFEKMISHRSPLVQINEAFAQAEWFGRQPDQAKVTRATIDPRL